jgi:Mrp family chromosome partitioning ATPase/capsular polysaccharide biosynthesis protein
VPNAAPMQLHDVGDEQPMDESRHLSAIRRGGWLIVLIVLPLTATVLALSLVLPKTYAASASITVEDTGSVLAPTDNESTTRRLATIRLLLTSRDVLARAARTLPGESADTLEDKVTASVDPVASIVNVRAKDGDPAGAARIANEVTRTFLAQRRAIETRRFVAARRAIELALERARASHAPADELQALSNRLSELRITALANGNQLQIGQAAVAPDGPDSPRPVQNTLIALVAALFIAMLAALVRDLLAPLVQNVRELTALTGLAPLVVIPSTTRRRRLPQVHEAYQALAASLRVQLSDSQRVVLITSPTNNEDRATVTFRLGRALASIHVPTLLVSADLRHPGLHKHLRIPQAPGLTDVLGSLDAGDPIGASALLRAQPQDPGGELRGLPSGEPVRHPTAALSDDALGVMFDELSRSEARYVLVEGPPLLGPIDGQLVARWVDAVVVVCRFDRLWPGNAAELGEVLARIEAPVLGAVLIGGRRVRYTLPAWTPRHAAGIASDE